MLEEIFEKTLETEIATELEILEYSEKIMKAEEVPCYMAIRQRNLFSHQTSFHYNFKLVKILGYDLIDFFYRS